MNLQPVTDSIVDDVEQLREVSVSPRGRFRRNGPCPCGSENKFKKCCLRKVRDGKLPHVTVRGYSLPIPTRYYPPKKQRYLERKNAD